MLSCLSHVELFESLGAATGVCQAVCRVSLASFVVRFAICADHSELSIGAGILSSCLLLGSGHTELVSLSLSCNARRVLTMKRGLHSE
jgi:hypothetical protein